MQPSAEEVPATHQLEFLSTVQRLLSEGSFSASYKFALLIAPGGPRGGVRRRGCQPAED